MATKPKITVSFKERDLGLRRVLDEAAKLRRKPYVEVGIRQDKGTILRPDGKKTVAEIAAIHEYGAPGANIPERSFIRSTVKENENKYNGQIEYLKDLIFTPDAKMTTERALGLIGMEVSSDIKNAIREGLDPPLKDTTIRQKNAGVIRKAKSTISGLDSKASSRGYKAAQKASGAEGPQRHAGPGMLTQKETDRYSAAKQTVLTGGASTPLIDTATMIRSIDYKVEMDGKKGGSK